MKTRIVVLFVFLINGTFLNSQEIIQGLPIPGTARSNRINLVVLSDGYTLAQSGLFFTPADPGNGVIARGDAWDFIREFVITPPFSNYLSFFDIYVVFEPSLVTGVMHTLTGQDCEPETPAQNLNPNRFLTSLDNTTTAGGRRFHRLLVSDPTLVHNFLHPFFLNAPLTVMVIANTNEWSGGGNPEKGIAHVCGGYTRNRVNPPANDYTDERMAIHEFGHSFGHLRDEYFYAPSASESPNMTQGDDWNDFGHTWHHWMGVTTNPQVGVFEHHEIPDCLPGPYIEGHTGWFKPTTGNGTSATGICKMELTQSPFCAVCREALIERIHTLVSPIDAFQPSNVEPLTSADNPLFKVTLNEPNPSYMRVEWYFNDVLIETDYGADVPSCISSCGTYEWQFNSNLLSGLDPGCYQVEARVFDMTGDSPTADNRLVRIPSHENHVWSVKWTFAIDWPAASDLYMLDRHPDLDNGEDKGYHLDWHYDEGFDIWVRHENDYDIDGSSEQQQQQEHQSPNYASSPEYVYVRVRNKGCRVSEAADLDLYASLSATSFSWPADWNGSNDNGYLIGNQTIPPIPGGGETVLEFEWDVANVAPEAYAAHNWDVCLLARIENETNDPIVVYPGDLRSDVWANNNVTLKNVTVVNFNNLISRPAVNGKLMPPGGFVRVANIKNTPQSYNLQFDIDPNVNTELVYAYREELGLYGDAEVIVTLFNDEWNITSVIADSMLNGLIRLDPNRFLVFSDHASINGIPFPANTGVPV